jgi:hypothetical protein
MPEGLLNKRCARQTQTDYSSPFGLAMAGIDTVFFSAKAVVRSAADELARITD